MRSLLLLICCIIPLFANDNQMELSDPIEQALHTEKDKYGIPNGLYAIDPKLVKLRKDIEWMQKSKKKKARQMLALSLVGYGVGAVGFALSPLEEDPPVSTYFTGVLGAGCGLTFTFIGLGKRAQAARVDTKKIDTYYRKKYVMR